MELVKVRCYTNLDSFSKEEWPIYMYNPKVGDYVKSITGRRLRIVSITHLFNDNSWPHTYKGSDIMNAVLEIELNQ